MIAIDLDDDPFINSSTLKVSFERTLRYLLFSFQATTVPSLSPVLTVSPTLNWLGLISMLNDAIFSNGIACPDDEGPLKMPGLVTEESNLYETVAIHPPGFRFTPVITEWS